ncbi:MAG TPA: DUF2231 domain-containing protein [Clostridia bacterium]|nr:DUF2231 domain-containing protein [Clostridia bacterium]
MQNNRDDSIQSKAALAGHPIHPMLIAFPIAFLIGMLVADVVYLISEDTFWARVSFWSGVAGIVTGLVSAVFGAIDFIGLRPVRQFKAAWIHVLGNIAALSLATINILLRMDNAATPIPGWGIALSGIVTLLLSITGWYGGELSYRHRVGVMRKIHTSASGEPQ